MSDHSPGPWRIGRHSQTVVCDTADNRTHSTLQEVEHYGGALVAESIKSEANARLIAAAPDLFEALDQILKRALEPDPSEFGLALVPCEVMVMAKAALNKAKGKL